MAAVAGRSPRLAPAILVLALILPAVCVIVDIVQRKHLEMEYHATAWIQRHVPPGALIYVNPNIRDPLPTVAASNALWDEVANENAWTTKLEWGMKRFHISSENLPRRPFSENDMVVERGFAPRVVYPWQPTRHPRSALRHPRLCRFCCISHQRRRRRI